MFYDIIIETNWMKKYDLHISFKTCKVVVNSQSVELKNIYEDLIQECMLIQAKKIKILLKEDKIVEMVVWSLIKTKENIDQEINP